MNLDKLKRLIGGRLRLRPKVKSRNERGIPVDTDDEWLLNAIDPKLGARIVNCRTGHIVDLGHDHIHHFTSTRQQPDGVVRGFLEIQLSINLKGDEVEVEPILSGAGRIRAVDGREDSRGRFQAVIVQQRLQIQQHPNEVRSVWQHGLARLMEAGADYAGRLGVGERPELERRLNEYGKIEEAELFQLSSLDVIDERTIAAAQMRRDESQRFLLAQLQRLADLAELAE